MIFDVIVDTLFEENLESALEVLGTGRLIKSKEDLEEPYLLGDEGYLVVRVRDREPYAFARELERRVSQMRIVSIVNRTPEQKE